MRIDARIRRLSTGNPANAKPISGGGESRINYGSGYRVYPMQRGAWVVISLCGGAKRTQGTDIEHAKRIASDRKE